MSSSFRAVPASAKVQPIPYTISVPEEQLQVLKTLVRCSKVGPETYESLDESFRFGLPRSWLEAAKHEWEHDFDWSGLETFLAYTN